MAEKIKQNQFEQVGVNPFNAPIPGESLTSSPDNPKAWERPPRYSNNEEAMMAVYLELTEPETLRKLIGIISEGIPLDEVAQVILYKGYTEGQFTTDMMLLLAEPTIYLLIAIADYAEIKDYVLYDGEDEDVDAMIPDDNITPIDMDEKEMPKSEIKREPSKKSVSSSLLSRIEKELPVKVEAATENLNEENIEE